MASTIHDLKGALQGLPAGRVSGAPGTSVRRALEEAWDSFSGSDDQSTWKSKIHRAEDLTWEPPVLSFILERHGATVGGSGRAELHHWQANLETGHAKIVKGGRRQLRPMARPLKTEPIVKKVADAIVNQKKIEWLTWKSPSVVLLKIGQVIPSTIPGTTAARRKRFRKSLTEALKLMEWDEVRPNVYEKK